MKATFMAALLAVSICNVATSAEARVTKTKHQTNKHRVIRDVTPLYASIEQFSARRYRYRMSRRHHNAAHHHRGGGRSWSTSLVGIVAPLSSKVQEIIASCGGRVISSHRNTRVAGTGHLSLHAQNRAVDWQGGNVSCAYTSLKGYPGGYTTDYSRVKHIHISYGGYEHGRRFAHGGGGRHYASHRHTRHAFAQPDYPIYADKSRCNDGGPCAVINDGSYRGKYKSMKHRRFAMAMQRHAARAY